MFVACSIPAGFQHVTDAGIPVFQLNGTHVGLDPANLPANGAVNNSANVESGYGITELTGDQEAAFMGWLESTPGPLKTQDGKDAAVQFAPIVTGAIQWNKSRAELVKAVSKTPGMAMSGAVNEMPVGVSSTADTPPPDKK